MTTYEVAMIELEFSEDELAAVLKEIQRK